MLSSIEQCNSLEELDTQVRHFSNPFGVTNHLGGIVPSRRILPKDQPGHVILGRWPSEWSKRYFARQYVESDPTIRHSRDETAPLQWRHVQATGVARSIMDEARSFGLIEGVTIPQFTVDGIKLGVSFSGQRLDGSPEAGLALIFLSSLATARAMVLANSGPPPAVSLTPRERECLLWMCEGKTDWETGQILGISRERVERHIRSVRTKLGAATRPHAVVLALRAGIIR